MKTSEIINGGEYAASRRRDLFDRYGFSAAHKVTVIEADYTYKVGDFGPGYYNGPRKGVLVATFERRFDGELRPYRKVLRPQDIKATWDDYLAQKEERDESWKKRLAAERAAEERARAARLEWEGQRDDAIATLKAAGVEGYIKTGYNASEAVTLTGEQVVALAAALKAAKVAA